MRQISFKNYIIYIVICLFTFLLLFIFVNKVKENDFEYESVMSGFLYEIKSDDFVMNLRNYAVDNPDFILYISNHNESSFDEELKQLILELNLNENMIYFNGFNKINNNFIKNFKVEFLNDYLNIGNEALKQSNLYVFKDGKIVDSLYKNKSEIIIMDVKLYLESYGENIYD